MGPLDGTLGEPLYQTLRDVLHPREDVQSR